jgi:DNA-directed RNA polymerase specialized sigma54-like protein
VCQLAKQFIQGSANYHRLSAPLRAFIDQQASALCQQLRSSPLTSRQKALVTAIVNGLVKPGWLTQTQATTLDAQIAQL